MTITDLPLKIVNVDKLGYHIFIKALVNNKVANLLVDTGASKTVFDSNRIQRFIPDVKITKNEHLSTGLGTNSMQSHTTMIKSLQLGDLSIKNFEIFLLDLSHVNSTYEILNYKPMDGVIGGEILMQYAGIINYKSKILRLSFKTPKK